MSSARISRRTVLRGLGTAVALPWLEAMAPAAGAAAKAGKPPVRMAFLYVPNGVHMKDWTPEAEGTDFTLPNTLRPLEAFREDMLVLTGLTQDNARAKGDGGGDHARALASFLTGCHPRKTDGADIQAGVSVDQVAAQRIGRATRFPSLELGIEGGRQAGNCDSGYSCAYSSNIAWRSPTTPVPKEINPRLVFERLFGGEDADESAATRARRQKTRRSILDFVREDAKSLSNRLGANDRRKLDEYLSSVRELEVRVARSEGASEAGPADLARPAGIPRELADHYTLMSDLLALAFQGDLTRVATFVYANEGSNRSYPFLGVPEGHHELSHHGRDPKKQEKIAKINKFHIEQFAYLLGKLKATREGDGSLLDHMMIVYGSGIGDGNRHNHDDLPVLLVGKGGGTIATGRHVRYEDETPLNNLFLSMLDRVDAPVEELGDSNGRLPKLQG
jgi:hypothetical protein